MIVNNETVCNEVDCAVLITYTPGGNYDITNPIRNYDCKEYCNVIIINYHRVYGCNHYMQCFGYSYMALHYMQINNARPNYHCNHKL